MAKPARPAKPPRRVPPLGRGPELGQVALRHVFGDDHLDIIIFCMVCVDFCHWLEAHPELFEDLRDSQRTELKTTIDLSLAIKSLEVDFQHAAWLARQDQKAEYEQFVRDVHRRSRAKETQRSKYLVARMAALTPRSPLAKDDLLALAASAAEGPESPTGFYRHTLGLAHLRSGDCEQALEQFRESTDLHWCPGLNDLAESLALHRLGRKDEARQAFERGRDWCRAEKVDSLESVLHWHDRLAAQLLLREANELF